MQTDFRFDNTGWASLLSFVGSGCLALLDATEATIALASIGFVLLVVTVFLADAEPD